MPQDQVGSDAQNPEVGGNLDDTAVMSAEDQAAIASPAIGERVLYRLPSGPAKGQLRSATVTYVHADGSVNLAVLCGLASDLPVFPVCPAENVSHGSKLGQFVWPSEVPA
jgi:hypothetical protein